MSACVYASQEELWEDLLYYALSRAQRERRNADRDGIVPGSSYRSACALARLHLFNLAAREWAVSPLLVEMARSEGLV